MIFKEKESAFEPPYDSPIEEALAWQLIKFIGPQTKFYKQVSVETPCETYILDFVIELNDLIIGIECDGKEFHKMGRDMWRDSLILGSSDIKEIFRFSGSSITYHVNECIYMLAKFYPDFFDERGLTNLDVLVDIEVKEDKFHDEKKWFNIDYHYMKGDIEKELQVIKITRLGEVEFPDWRKHYNFFVKGNFSNLEDAMKQYNDFKEN